jgi:hypothetical protein
MKSILHSLIHLKAVLCLRFTIVVKIWQFMLGINHHSSSLPTSYMPQAVQPRKSTEFASNLRYDRESGNNHFWPRRIMAEYADQRGISYLASKSTAHSTVWCGQCTSQRLRCSIRTRLFLGQETNPWLLVVTVTLALLWQDQAKQHPVQLHVSTSQWWMLVLSAQQRTQ